MFSAPIPGESLTSQPKNATYERPPEMTDPEDALVYHIDRLTDFKRMGALVGLLESGIDIRTLTEGLLRMGVFDGIHSIDVSLLIAPAVHEYIKTTADMIGVDYKEGFEDEESEEDIMYQIDSIRAKKSLAKIQADPKEAVAAFEGEEEMPEEAISEDVVEPIEQPKPQGLMSRRAV